MIYSGLDLKCAPWICDPARNSLAGGVHEPGQTGLCASHAALAADNVSSLRGPLWRRAQGQDLFLSRPISLDGIRPTDLSRELARHRGVPQSPRKQALPYGYQEPGVAQHAPSLPERVKLRIARAGACGSIRDKLNRKSVTNSATEFSAWGSSCPLLLHMLRWTSMANTRLFNPNVKKCLEVSVISGDVALRMVKPIAGQFSHETQGGPGMHGGFLCH